MDVLLSLVLLDPGVLQLLDRALQTTHAATKRTVVHVRTALQGFNARERNAVASSPLRLPGEVWCIIWEDRALSMSDRLLISHVCRDWRPLSISTRRLWCRLDVWWKPSSAKPSTAWWRPCAAPLHNLAAVPYMLQRSRDLPLDLRVVCTDDGVPQDVFELVNMLAPHAARLAEIHAAVYNPDVLRHLLRRLGHLPVLHFLSASRAPGACLSRHIDLALDGRAMPRLRRVELRYWNFKANPVSAPPQLASVRNLECTSTTAASLHDILATFPGLTSATLHSIGMDLTDDSWRTWALAHRIPYITLHGITRGQQKKLLEIFGHARAREALALHFLADEYPRDATLAVLRDLQGGRLHASWTLSTRGVTLELRDQLSGRARTLAFAARHAFTTFESALRCGFLPCTSVRTLTVSIQLWPHICHAWGAGFDVERIELLVPAEFDFARFSLHRPAYFPDLASVNIVAAGAETIVIPEVWLQAFVISLGAQRLAVELVGLVLGRAAAASVRDATEAIMCWYCVCPRTHNVRARTLEL